MSDPIEPTEPAATEPNEPEPAEPKEPTVDPEAEAKKWKAIALKHEAKVKEYEPAVQKYQELMDAGKSETEKLQAALEEQKAKERAATVKALKLDALAHVGLERDWLDYLPDHDNEVDMLQAAEKVKELRGAGKVDSPTNRPKSDLNNPLGDDTDPASDREKMIASMMGKTTK